MRFTIITTKPGHQPPQSSCDFSPPGGTIGRGTDNNLVLPDNDRAISRLQAIVHISADGECRITNRGNVTRMMLNDVPLDRGRQVELQDGDILGIDEYRLQVSELTLNASPAPGNAAAAQRPAQTPPAENVPTAVPAEIWDSLMQEFSISDNISGARSRPPEEPLINPFSAPQEPERNPEDPLAHFDTQEPLFDKKHVETDQLFNNEELFNSDSIFNDATPTTLTPSGNASSPQANDEENELDPLALFAGAGSGKSHINSEDPLGLLGGALPLTQPDDAEIAPEPQSVPRSEAPATADNEIPAPAKENTPFSYSPADNSSLLSDEPEEETPRSQEQEPQDYASITLPTPQTVQRSASQTPTGRLRIDPVNTSDAQSRAAASSVRGDVLHGELLEALLEGMGLGDMQPIPQFDRDSMHQLGQMLSMFSQGTVALLSSRSILKRGVKADMTMVLDDANNPFKLLPSGKTVLMQMFGSRMPGFMPPKKSVRDALIDLQAHQLGMISGIRAIIAAMLQSFNPDLLEEAAKRDGATSRLSLSTSRKAALWDYFVRQYNDTAGEIEDDFHTLFGEAFLHAYDMEVNQYKDSQSGSE
ncbi:type VI secretion system-associated FHA domain protein TagH [Brenneria tiliae]|uniref:type VI secretion system-associated FHA domain protein TagH n=1 Tax=Brenneria tiliae TaxID=2914984 RepID=UPI00201491D7|nr:type VI secretion system-associated FHA domain protein TagH [Brenneria tiliae]MCL2897384.1 type VI secretion system-associated FHA domain protein TagH [Brenneria tiliae]MCL2901673.1 type VI secretion system-associated FHA domain protein TagH [Brenneria tiliae]